MTKVDSIPALIGSHLAAAWPGTTQALEPAPMTGGFWASMYRLHLEGQPHDVPPEVVFRIAPDAAMGAKELVVQRTVANLGFATPRVRLSGPADDVLGGAWSVTDFAPGTSPLGDLNGFSALRRGPGRFARLPDQLARPMSELHSLDPEPVSSAVAVAAPTVAWSVEDLLEHFEGAAEVLGRSDLAGAARALAALRPTERTTVICHGDLHPFNLLIDVDGDITVIDWTAAIRAEPAYDVAFTSMLLANPPLDARGPLATAIRWVGTRLAHRFVARYRALVPEHDLGTLDWYSALHGTRVLLEAASAEAHHGPGASGNPLRALVPAASSALHAVTGTPVTTKI